MLLCIKCHESDCGLLFHGKSYGTCECCGKICECLDCPTSLYMASRKQKSTVHPWRISKKYKKKARKVIKNLNTYVTHTERNVGRKNKKGKAQ